LTPDVVNTSVCGLPYMTLPQAWILYDLITTHKLHNCIELGFHHGVSSCYIAGAIQDSGRGHLTTVDLQAASSLSPHIGDLLARLDLAEWVSVFFEPRSYTWRLMRLLEQGMYGHFDFCYIDGGHNWDNTGFALSLVAHLLKPNGWVVFDDLDWTFEMDHTLASDNRIRALPEDEKITAGVRKVFELLVRKDDRFCNVYERGQWGFAQRSG
jgi:predicted O-methyltransferase YrrM